MSALTMVFISAALLAICPACQNAAVDTGGGESSTLTVTEFDICTRPNSASRNRLLDAITTVADGNTYAFLGIYYWKIGPGEAEKLALDYPRMVSTDWRGLPTDGLDAAVTWKNRTYFFKGELCWPFFNQQLITYRPVPISSEFPGIPTPIDAAFVWSSNNKAAEEELYFVKSNQYWRFDEHGARNQSLGSAPRTRPNSAQHVITLAPAVRKHAAHEQRSAFEGGQRRSTQPNVKLERIWPSVPKPVDAAFKLHRDGPTYFVSGNTVTRFRKRSSKQIESGYPKDIREHWFNCKPPLPQSLKSAPITESATTEHVQQQHRPFLPDFECKIPVDHIMASVPGVVIGLVGNVASADDCCRLCQIIAQSGCDAFEWWTNPGAANQKNGMNRANCVLRQSAFNNNNNTRTADVNKVVNWTTPNANGTHFEDFLGRFPGVDLAVYGESFVPPKVHFLPSRP